MQPDAPTPAQLDADPDPATRPAREGEIVVSIRGRHHLGFELDLASVFLFPPEWSPAQLEAYARLVLAAAQDSARMKATTPLLRWPGPSRPPEEG